MDCIIATGSLGSNGYGRATYEGKQQLAHRVVWQQHHGPIPKGMVIMHICDNPPCINIDHLTIGTQADNLADMATKGRSVKGRRVSVIHGTVAGHSHHRRYGQSPCQPCRDAFNAYRRVQ